MRCINAWFQARHFSRKVLGAFDGKNVGCSEVLSDGTSLWNDMGKYDGVLLINLDG